MPGRVEQFQALVARQPGNELFRFSLAQALLAEQRNAEAMSQLEYCVAAKPDWMMPRILLGKELLTAGRSEEAKPLLESALKLALAQDHDDPADELRQILAGM